MNARLADPSAEKVSASVGKTERIGRFRVLKRMPSPGSRDVFLATDLKGLQVVLEVLGAPQRNQGLFDPTLAEEAATYAGLSHPNLVKVVDLFSADGRFVIAIEYVDGTTLDVLRSTFAHDGAAQYTAHGYAVKAYEGCVCGSVGDWAVEQSIASRAGARCSTLTATIEMDAADA